MIPVMFALLIAKRLGVQTFNRLRSMAPSLTSSMTVGKFLNLFTSQLPHLVKHA